MGERGLGEGKLCHPDAGMPSGGHRRLGISLRRTAMGATPTHHALAMLHWKDVGEWHLVMSYVKVNGSMKRASVE